MRHLLWNLESPGVCSRETGMMRICVMLCAFVLVALCVAPVFAAGRTVADEAPALAAAPSKTIESPTFAAKRSKTVEAPQGAYWSEELGLYVLDPPIKMGTYALPSVDTVIFYDGGEMNYLVPQSSQYYPLTKVTRPGCLGESFILTGVLLGCFNYPDNEPDIGWIRVYAHSYSPSCTSVSPYGDSIGALLGEQMFQGLPYDDWYPDSLPTAKWTMIDFSTPIELWDSDFWVAWDYTETGSGASWYTLGNWRTDPPLLPTDKERFFEFYGSPCASRLDPQYDSAWMMRFVGHCLCDIDTTAPVIVCPPDTVLQADENCEAVYSGPPATATDNCDPNPVITSDPPLPATLYGVGDHYIEYTATDDRGNSSSCTQKITVVDVTPPLIACPPDQVMDAGANCEVVYTGPPATATDNCDASPDMSSIPPLPATFSGVGDHYIEYRAVDASGNMSTCVQTITIVDVTPPLIACPPDQVMEADENCEVVYSGPAAIAADNCDPDPDMSSIPPLPATFSGVGDHYIEYRATDASGNMSTCTQMITIVDVTPPEITCPPDVALEPEGMDCCVTYSGPPATATDNCDVSPAVTSDPPLPATFCMAGDYPIVFRATDFSGNASVCTMTVTVLPTSLCLKGGAIELLLGLKPTGDNHLDKEIDKIVWHIEKSLDPDLWLDVKHLDCQHGQKVFNEEETAVVLLRENMQKKKFPPELVDDFVAATIMLVDADEILAETQLEDAIARGGDQKHIEKAKREIVLAREKRDAEDYQHAIDHYRNAWHEACKALAKTSQSGAQVVRQAGKPREFRMSEARPNPFGKAAVVDYEIPVASDVNMRIFDVSGRLVRTIVDYKQDAGIYSVRWDGTNSAGDRVSSGIYFIRLVAGETVCSKKVVLRWDDPERPGFSR
jgi:hypothetical protein